MSRIRSSSSSSSSSSSRSSRSSSGRGCLKKREHVNNFGGRGRGGGVVVHVFTFF